MIFPRPTFSAACRPQFDLLLPRRARLKNDKVAGPEFTRYPARGMLGTILNAIGILIGGLLGLILKRSPSAVHQSTLKVLLGAFTVFFGLRLSWKSVNGSFSQVLRQLSIVVLALILGKLTGRLLGLQSLSNRAGQFAKARMEAIRPGTRGSDNDGFILATLLFCLTPLAILGAIQDGLSDYFQPLVIKAVVDGLSTMAFVLMFGPGTMLCVLPVVAYQGLISLAARSLEPALRSHGLVDPINAAGGLLIFCVALIILELKKIEVTNYLPALAFAPLIAWLWRW